MRCVKKGHQKEVVAKKLDLINWPVFSDFEFLMNPVLHGDDGGRAVREEEYQCRVKKVSDDDAHLILFNGEF